MSSTTTNSPAAVAVRPTVAVWFEIPAGDFERAVKFYEQVFATTLRRERFGQETLAIFPYERPGISGAIVDRAGDGGSRGPIVYLNCDGRLEAALAAVVPAGGTIVTPRTSLGDTGFSALVADPEGNRIGLHAMS